MRPALELRDLLDQVRELVRIELSLFRAEIGERTRGIPSSLMAVVVGVVLLPVALGLILVAASLFLRRFGLPSRPRVSDCRRRYDCGQLTPPAFGRCRPEAVTT